MLFSQRKGLKSVKSIVQKDSMDEALRNGLWDVLHVCVWDSFKVPAYGGGSGVKHSNLASLFAAYWHGYFRIPLDQMPYAYEDAHGYVRKYFFNCEWYEVYDFIEFTAKQAPEQLSSELVRVGNRVLERELSAYRLIDNRVVEITAEEEIASIEEALQSTHALGGIHGHLKAALSLMSDRKQPDFRNSIKESISAVEALAQLLTGERKATLGAALKVLEQKASIHGALKAGLSSLYGYTSDEHGIRHAMLDEPSLTYNDAKFMLVACTAFVNYLIGRAAEEGIKLS